MKEDAKIDALEGKWEIEEAREANRRRKEINKSLVYLLEMHS